MSKSSKKKNSWYNFFFGKKNKKAEIPLSKTKRRIYNLTIVFMALMVLVIGKTGIWQTVYHSEMKERVKAQQQSQSTVTASRGKIFDRNGKILAESASANNLVCNPNNVKEHGDIEYAATAISEIVDMDRDKVKEALGRTDYRYSIIKKKIYF